MRDIHRGALDVAANERAGGDTSQARTTSVEPSTVKPCSVRVEGRLVDDHSGRTHIQTTRIQLRGVVVHRNLGRNALPWRTDNGDSATALTAPAVVNIHSVQDELGAIGQNTTTVAAGRVGGAKAGYRCLDPTITTVSEN